MEGERELPLPRRHRRAVEDVLARAGGRASMGSGIRSSCRGLSEPTFLGGTRRLGVGIISSRLRESVRENLRGGSGAATSTKGSREGFVQARRVAHMGLVVLTIVIVGFTVALFFHE